MPKISSMAYQVDSYSFQGKRALIRVDFNVPLNEQFVVTDDTRIRAALKTIKRVSDDGGRVILMSHLGRPKGGPEAKYSMRHILSRLTELLGRPVAFAEDCIGDKVKTAVDAMQNGDV